MTQAAVQSTFTREAFETFAESRGEPGWLEEVRRQAWELFESLPLPDRRSEEWMRTDLRAFHLEAFGFPTL